MVYNRGWSRDSKDGVLEKNKRSKEGNAYLALNEVAKQLKQNGVESEIVWIGTELE